MSLKSQKRAHSRNSDKIEFPPLPRQKAVMRKAAFDHLCGSALLLFLLLILLLTAPGDGAKYAGIAFIPLTISFAAVLVGTARRIKIYRQINKIEFASEDRLDVCFKRLRFMNQLRGRYSSVLICLCLEAENGGKFYYVYPRGGGDSFFDGKYLKEKLLHKDLQIICYRNSSFIKYLPD